MNPSPVPDDTAWQFAQTAIGVAALLATVALLVFFYLGSRKRKALSCRVIAASPLPGLSGDLQLLDRGEPITAAYLILIQISNVGNTLISAADYERPISLNFAHGTRILAADVAGTTPEGWGTTARIEGATVTLTRPPLEPGEAIVLGVLVNVYPQPVQIDWQIAGTRAVSDISPESTSAVSMPAASAAWSIGTIQTILTAVALALTFTSCILSLVAVIGPTSLSLSTAPVVLVILTSLILIPVIVALRRTDRANRE